MHAKISKKGQMTIPESIRLKSVKASEDMIEIERLKWHKIEIRRKISNLE